MKALILTLALFLNFSAHAAITYNSGNLSPSINEYDPAFMTDGNGNKIPMLMMVFPDANGNTGILSSKIVPGITSQVTGRRSPPLYKGANSTYIPMFAMTGVNTSTNLPVPFSLPSSSLSAIASVTCGAGAGGAATAALTCTGLISADTVLAVTQVTPGANGLALVGYSTLITNGITAIWHADPGAGAVVQVLVKHQ